MKKILIFTCCATLSFIYFSEKNENIILGNEEIVFVGTTKGLEFNAKIDSGAETSSIHAENIQTFESDFILNGNTQKAMFVQFSTTDDKGKSIVIERPISRIATVKSASGSRERIFIQEKVWIGNKSFKIEINLTDRSHLSKKMLIGRNLIKLGYLIDAKKAFLVSYR